IGEAERRSQETIDRYREAEQRLRSENERLAKQNEQLAEAVEALQQAERERAERARRTWTIVWTAIGLVALYFALARLFRLMLRSKQSRI
ncbi:hypothetical protein PV407_12330, partial [Paenibacillus sp. GYB003]